jgi:hypothetical protein
MELNHILELLNIAKERQTKGLLVPEETIAKTIIALEKVIEENDKMKVIGESAPVVEEPKDEIVSIKPLVFKDSQEKAFWEKAYLAVFNSNFGNPPQNIADMAVCELRKRLEKKNEQ